MTFSKRMTKSVSATNPLKMQLQYFNGGEENKELETLQKSFNDSWKELKGLLDTQADEMRNFGETNQKTADGIKTLETKITNYETELKGITDKFTDLETKFNRVPTFGGETPKKSAGELFVSSDSYKSMIEKGDARSESVAIKSFFRKDLDSSPANGGVLVQRTRVPDIIATPEREMTLRDLLNVQTTTSNAIEFIQETGFTNNARIVPEKQLKPMSDIEFDVQTATVKTIAHMIPATRQIIADATQLQNYINSRLNYGLRVAEENQILFGSGAGDDLQGIMTHDGIQDAGAPAGDDTMIDHIRRAITLNRLAGYPTTGVVLNPRDVEQIELMKGNDGHYIWINVNNGGEPRLFRVPIVESLAMPENQFLMGSFGLGAQLWDRESANIRVSEHHADYFARNMLAILAEERMTQTIYRPESFVSGVFGA